MSNLTCYYFGAYLEIKTKKIKKEQRFLGCKNGHRERGPYCAQCGLIVGEQSETVSAYPTFIYDHLLDDKRWEDVLRVITPPELYKYKTDTMIAIGNLNSSQWLYLDGYYHEVQMKDFPSPNDIATMIAGQFHNYADIIMELRESRNVIRVEEKAGYVLDKEY